MANKKIDLLERPIEYEDDKPCQCGECGSLVNNKPKPDKLWPDWPDTKKEINDED